MWARKFWSGRNCRALVPAAVVSNRDPNPPCSLLVRPQGSVRLLSPSTLLSDESGFWRIDATDDGGMPVVLQWRLGTSGIAASGETLVPKGPIYCNALVAARPNGGVNLVKGRHAVESRSRVASDVVFVLSRSVRCGSRR